MKTKEWHVLTAVIAAGLMSFSGVLIETSMNVTFPHLMSEFNTNASGIQWVTTGYLLAIAVIVPISAYLLKNFSIKKLFIIANLFFLAGVGLDSIAMNLTILLFGRVLQGIGTGIALPLMFQIILMKSPMEKRGAMMGIGTMTTAIAPAIGPTYGGLLLSTLGWRSIFWFLVPLLLLSLVLGLRSIPSETVVREDRFNWGAFLTLMVGLSTLLIAVEKLSLPLFVISVIFLIGFYFFNRRLPLLNLHVFKNMEFDMLTYSFLIYQAMLLGLSFILPNYLQIGMHTSATEAGLFMFPGAVIGAILAPISGRLFDRIGAVKPILTGIVASATGLLLMALFFPVLNFWFLMATHVLLMIGNGLAYSNLMTVTLGTLPEHESADGNSILNTLQQFIGASATAIVAQIFATTVKTAPNNGVMLGSRYGVILLATLMLISLVLFVIAKKGMQQRA
ncbi:EmrB/QacA subfamily drug resistance transporter [Weissella uvarum]|uniref:MFS transporter n=1 Tax=Weissella uvarum TaxID=1479233 RepID=UPI00195FAB7A|nr:MFS transporter [Weissella uvarum]MBM7617518.1 EmrB/QacA subfamily drug resistance transporter [Weissella uvarum]MCM0595598.1 MFS transporter [Weissella uvarum]